MKLFFFRLCGFCIFSILVLALTFVTVNATQYRLLRLPQDRHILYLGNSHVEAAVNDSIITGAFNFGRSAERIETLYAKLKMMKRVNPQIDTVFIGLDYILLSHSTEASFNSVLIHPYDYFEFEFDDWCEIFAKGSFDYLESFFSHPLGWMKLVDFLKLYKSDVNVRDCRFMGGFLQLDRNILHEDTMYKDEIMSKPFDRIPMNYYFAQQCVDFCQKNSIKLIFFATPFHKNCPFSKYQNQIVKDFWKSTFLDYTRMSLPDSCFYDLDHLNISGAESFSTIMELQLHHSTQKK